MFSGASVISINPDEQRFNKRWISSCVKHWCTRWGQSSASQTATRLFRHWTHLWGRSSLDFFSFFYRRGGKARFEEKQARCLWTTRMSQQVGESDRNTYYSSHGRLVCYNGSWVENRTRIEKILSFMSISTSMMSCLSLLCNWRCSFECD